MRRTTVSGLLTLLLGLSAIPVFAQGRLTLYLVLQLGRRLVPAGQD